MSAHFWPFRQANKWTALNMQWGSKGLHGGLSKGWQREAGQTLCWVYRRKYQYVYAPRTASHLDWQCLEWCLLSQANWPTPNTAAGHRTRTLLISPFLCAKAPHWSAVSSQRQQLSLGWRSYFWGASQSDCLQLENPWVPHGLQNAHGYGIKLLIKNSAL